MNVGVVLKPALSFEIPVSELGSKEIVIPPIAGASRSIVTANVGAEPIWDEFPPHPEQ